MSAPQAGAAEGICLSCGRPLTQDHSRCALDPPRFCQHCGRRLRVQVNPTGFRAHCPSCDRDVRPGAPNAAGDPIS